MTQKFLQFISFTCLILIFSLMGIPNAQGQQDDPVDPRPEPRIVGGTLADEHEYPWQAALVGFWQFCGGSLIDTNWVLSAAHCFYDNNGNQTTFANDFDIYLGVNNLNEGTRRSVAELIIHPGYNPFNQRDDIALIRLAETASLSCEVNTIRHAAPADSSKFAAGQIATITGWGDLFSGANQGTDDLREVSVPIVSQAVCRDSYGNSSITDSMLCAGLAAGGKDSCQGDSGGPLVVADGDQFIQAGVVSWGFGCADPGYYGVYTRVSDYKGWIDNHINATRQAPSSVVLDTSQLSSYIFLPFISSGIQPGTSCTPTK